MVRALAVSDEEVAGLRTDAARRFGVDLVIAAGDLAFDYLAELSDRVDRPGVLVPGNHDADLSGFTRRSGLWLRAGHPCDWPGPAGYEDADGRIVDVAGLRIAGLGGSVRYRPGPNQWTQRQQARRARKLVRVARRRQHRDGRGVDVLLTHAPPRGCGDREDGPHHGFECLHDVVAALQPRLLVHGHIHPYGDRVPDRILGRTRVVNVVGRRVLEV
ncbi:metallophosphoesterase family protein [Pseudonocardia bannensis]|uniref:Metallophosphoesterase n=1 Tax=Pseudonocardia bannensis TaxID=630973 RepID=A0A848DLH1_9PSEU|nr:metallophosphoesterase [Pseudonocardia bannensis]NMH93597.1 metallophosphoesterase [Pseudonocardia bannensis]